ncbi:spore coat associated protein CotJA [Mobilitalea sibirica]|uniref:Spore coat associated protein CotJA n=2 Tax=Mobilitalea sibirica TaxID=1462919 RepID=A0A8J7H8V7_9FIRM|nr:spore coat associated protein CotJA [Mobilitalea sibirica]
MGNGYGCRGVSPYKSKEPVCSDVIDDYGRKDVCERDEVFELDRFPIGMCYVPWQCFRDLYENEFVALDNGTLFKELDLDWYGRGCK